MSKHLTPLQVCVALIAPLKDLGTVAGYNQKTAYKWVPGSSWRGPGELPPPAARRLLSHVRQHDLGVEAHWLIEGASEEDVARVLNNRGLAAREIVKRLDAATFPVAA